MEVFGSIGIGALILIATLVLSATGCALLESYLDRNHKWPFNKREKVCCHGYTSYGYKTPYWFECLIVVIVLGLTFASPIIYMKAIEDATELVEDKEYHDSIMEIELNDLTDIYTIEFDNKEKDNYNGCYVLDGITF